MLFDDVLLAIYSMFYYNFQYFPLQKAHFLKDVIIDTVVPLFATTLYRDTKLQDEWETDIMNNR